MRAGLLLVVVLAGLPAAAAAQDDPAPAHLLPSAAPARVLPEAGEGPEPSPLLPPLRLQAGDVASQQVDGGDAGGYSMHRRYVLPVALSALVPGAGEIATGHWLRGVPLVAADVATWIGYGHFRAEGRDWRDRYEAFADRFWDYGRWQRVLREHYDGDPASEPAFYDPDDASDHCVCAWISLQEDRQHYYENIGKYDYYWGGWQDWSSDRRDSEGLRRAYADMRIESNDNFDRSTNLIVVAMATRLLSAVQTVFLVRGDLQRETRLGLRPLKMSGRGAGIELTYEY
jgi:hypothetical protein